MRPRPPAIKTDGKIANPPRPSVRLTALDEPIITKILISRKISGEIIKIYSLLKGKIKICSFPLGGLQKAWIWYQDWFLDTRDWFR